MTITSEFQKYYFYMLKKEIEDKNYDYNYRLISNIFLNDNNLNSNNDHYIYLFGLFPCKYIPSAYIPTRCCRNHKLAVVLFHSSDTTSYRVRDATKRSITYFRHLSTQALKIMGAEAPTIVLNCQPSVIFSFLTLLFSVALFLANSKDNVRMPSFNEDTGSFSVKSEGNRITRLNS